MNTYEKNDTNATNNVTTEPEPELTTEKQAMTATELTVMQQQTGRPLLQMRGMALLNDMKLQNQEISIQRKIVCIHKVKYGPGHAAVFIQKLFRGYLVRKPFDYAEEWTAAYGCMTRDNNDYRIHISGNGDPNTPNGYEDFSIKKIDGALEYFVVHYDDPRRHVRMTGKKLVCSPDGNYNSWQDEDYELRWDKDGDYELDFDFLLGN